MTSGAGFRILKHRLNKYFEPVDIYLSMVERDDPSAD